MSRVDEALRRAAAAPLIDTRGITLRRDVSSPVAEEFTLAHYPREPAAVEAVEAWPITGGRGRVAPPPGIEEKLVVRADDAVVVQYQRLVRVLGDARRERGLKAVIVTSALDEDGRTRTALELALALGEAGERVLLIDGNLRRPWLHHLLELPNDIGFAEELRSPSRELSCVDLSPVLSVLTAGHPPSDPLPLLTSERIRLLLERGTSQFDWVLMDAPPITASSDASLLARMVQAVVVVIGGATPLPVAAAALARVGRQYVLGTVLTGNAPVLPSPPSPAGA